MIWIAFIALGIIAGVMSGLIGIGGGIIIVPALVFLFGFSQKLAQGTTLALLIPPIGILAALAYYKQGNVNIPVAIVIALGFVLGSLLGAKYALTLSNATVTRIFAVFLMLIAIKLFFYTK